MQSCVREVRVLGRVIGERFGERWSKRLRLRGRIRSRVRVLPGERIWRNSLGHEHLDSMLFSSISNISRGTENKDERGLGKKGIWMLRWSLKSGIPMRCGRASYVVLRKRF
jgi:hypothetical protein